MAISRFIFSFIVLSLCACTNGSLLSSVASTVGNSEDKKGPRLYIFDCGFLEFRTPKKVADSNQNDHGTDVRKMFVPCYLVEHKGQRLFWDGGLPLDMVGKGNVSIMPGVTAHYARSVIDQLADLDLTPSDIDFVAFSHMHLDHAGAGNAFTDSTMLIQRSEYQHAFIDFKKSQGLYPPSYMELIDAESVLLDGEYDVFGDGVVRLIPAPGHTPGHQLLWLKLSEMGPLILSGDLYHDQKSRDERHVPSFNTDHKQTLESMHKIERIIKKTGATFWISHDPLLADMLELAPAYYE